MTDKTAAPEVSDDDVQTALRITPLFYDAVLDPARWQVALQALTAWFPGARGSAFHLFRQVPNVELEQYLHVNFGFTQEETARHLEFDDFLHGDPRALRYEAKALNKPGHCRQFVSDEEWYASPIYKKVFGPSNIDYSLICVLRYEQDNIHFSGGIFRPTSVGPFDDYDISKMQLLIPHLRRAGAVYARIMQAEERSRQLEQVLEDIGLATVFVDEKGRIANLNAGARKLAASGDGFTIANNTIGHEHGDTARALKTAISHVVANVATGNDETVRHIALPRHSNTKPLQATVCSLTRNPNRLSGWVQNQMKVAIFITDPTQSYESRLEKLQRMYGLTTAEAGVLALLVDGATTQDIAARRGSAVETVRTQLKTIMSKTNTHRQADLVRLVLAAG